MKSFAQFRGMEDALKVIKKFQIPTDRDFHKLSDADVKKITKAADAMGYNIRSNSDIPYNREINLFNILMSHWADSQGFKIPKPPKK